jgi:hypothetical protein
MSVKKLTVFETSDGHQFPDEHKALRHENLVRLWDKALSDHGSYGEVTFGCKDDFLEFIKNNKESILISLGE